MEGIFVGFAVFVGFSVGNVVGCNLVGVREVGMAVAVGFVVGIKEDFCVGK